MKSFRSTVRSPFFPRHRTCCGQSTENYRPITAGIGFGQRAADGAAIADLHIGNAGGAVVQDGDFGCDGRILDFRMTSQRPEVKVAVGFIDLRSSRDKVEVHQMCGIGEAQLHQRDEALAAGQQLGVVPELRQYGRCFFQRSSAMIMKRSRIHRLSQYCPPAGRLRAGE